MGGNGALQIDGMKGVRGELSLAGNGDLDVSGVALDHLIVNSAGGGRIRMAGQAGDARLQVICAGTIEARGLTPQPLNILYPGPNVKHGGAGKRVAGR